MKKSFVHLSLLLLVFTASVNAYANEMKLQRYTKISLKYNHFKKWKSLAEGTARIVYSDDYSSCYVKFNDRPGILDCDLIPAVTSVSNDMVVSINSDSLVDLLGQRPNPNEDDSEIYINDIANDKLAGSVIRTRFPKDPTTATFDASNGRNLMRLFNVQDLTTSRAYQVEFLYDVQEPFFDNGDLEL